MRLKYKVTLMIIIVLLAITTTMGSSYAFWSITQTQTVENVMSSGCLSLEFNDYISETQTSINLTNAFPIEDEDGLNFSPYTVTLTNNCSLPAKYDLVISTDESNTLPDELIKTSIKNVTINVTAPVSLLNQFEIMDLDANIVSIIENNDIDVKDSYKLSEGVLDVSEQVTYELRMWLSYAATSEQINKVFNATVSSVAYATSINAE